MNGDCLLSSYGSRRPSIYWSREGISHGAYKISIKKWFKCWFLYTLRGKHSEAAVSL